MRALQSSKNRIIYLGDEKDPLGISENETFWFLESICGGLIHAPLDPPPFDKHPCANNGNKTVARIEYAHQESVMWIEYILFQTLLKCRFRSFSGIDRSPDDPKTPRP